MSRQSFRAWEAHLEEVIGVAHAESVVDHLEDHVTGEAFAAGLHDLEERLEDRLVNRLSSMWRRDLLLVMTGQFVALAGVLTAVT